MEPEGPNDRTGVDYASHQLAKAFVAALSHDDPKVRSNAENRVAKWRAVLSGVASGRIRVGSRAPVADLPIWVTPEVVRGGFATGSAAVASDLEPHEVDWSDRLGVPRSRQAIFAALLTERGLQELLGLLRSGRYRVMVPEEAALLAVAWLVDKGDVEGGLQLVEVVEPYADRLCFVPRRGNDPRDLEIVSRETVEDVSGALAGRRINHRVETMREALAVWSPFEDDLVAFWLRVLDGDGEVEGLRSRAGRFRARYVELAESHRLCTKHRNPKENLARLVAGLDPFASSGDVPPSVRHSVKSIVAKRGRQGSESHTTLRRRQAHNAAIPAHHLLAQVVVGRLSELPQDRGVANIDDLVVPVTPEEEAETGLPMGTPMPPSVHRAVRRAIEGPVDELLDRGLVPSAEVLARLVPQIAAATTAASYPDEASQWLVAQSYLAFRNRRSLLLLDYEHQVRLDELPWMKKLDEHKASERGSDAGSSLRRLSDLTLRGFPATVIPNPLVVELNVLATEAGVDVPLVDELAADIFMGSFTAKYLRAAQVAAELLDGTLYSRYYDIDYGEIARMRVPQREGSGPALAEEFAAMCRHRAGDDERTTWSVARNGTIIEQAQILTTQNLAALVNRGGVREMLDGSWSGLAARSFGTVATLIQKVERNPRPLGRIKDAASAWRHFLFYVSMLPAPQQESAIDTASQQLARAADHVQRRLAPAMLGLEHVAGGGSLFDTAAPTEARQFTGWAVGRHWISET